MYNFDKVKKKDQIGGRTKTFENGYSIKNYLLCPATTSTVMLMAQMMQVKTLQ